MTASALIGAATGIYLRSASCGIIAFFAGILIDIDHVMDFLISHGRGSFSKFYETMLRANIEKFYGVLHSYEVVCALWVCISVFSLGAYWISFAVGVTQHLILDQLFNPIRPWGYFLTFRMLKGFKTDDIVYRHKIKF
ncbi:MAG: hypothetical protein ABH885_08545 [Candidatus Omnitrophota bacterium]